MPGLGEEKEPAQRTRLAFSHLVAVAAWAPGGQEPEGQCQEFLWSLWPPQEVGQPGLAPAQAMQ